MPGLKRLTVATFFFATTSVALAGTHSAKFQSSGRSITYEIFDSKPAEAPLLILLPGTSGPEALFYRSQADHFTSNGYEVLLLHYFDAASSHFPDEHTYQAWTTALADLVRECRSSANWKGRNIFVIGYSLGASVALAAGSQGLPVTAIAEWYGSLPDSFFNRLSGMPPLLILHGALDLNIPVINGKQLMRMCEMKQFTCANHIYPDQGHGFEGVALSDAEERTRSFFKEHQHAQEVSR